MAVDPLSTSDIRLLDGKEPGAPVVGDPAARILLGTRLVEMAASIATLVSGLAAVVSSAAASALALSKMVSGSATILNTGTSVVVAVGTAYNGKPVHAQMSAADGTKYILSAIVSGGNLTITLSAAATADRVVYYFIDGR